MLPGRQPIKPSGEPPVLRIASLLNQHIIGTLFNDTPVFKDYDSVAVSDGIDPVRNYDARAVLSRTDAFAHLCLRNIVESACRLVKNRISGLRISARAIKILCFCPPDMVPASSFRMVCSLIGISSISGCSPTSRTISFTSCIDAFGFVIVMFS